MDPETIDVSQSLDEQFEVIVEGFDFPVDDLITPGEFDIY